MELTHTLMRLSWAKSLVRDAYDRSPRILRKDLPPTCTLSDVYLEINGCHDFLVGEENLIVIASISLKVNQSGEPFFILFSGEIRGDDMHTIRGMISRTTCKNRNRIQPEWGDSYQRIMSLGQEK